MKTVQDNIDRINRYVMTELEDDCNCRSEAQHISDTQVALTYSYYDFDDDTNRGYTHHIGIDTMRGNLTDEEIKDIAEDICIIMEP